MKTNPNNRQQRRTDNSQHESNQRFNRFGRSNVSFFFVKIQETERKK